MAAPHKVIRVTLEEALLTAVDEAAARAGETRSAFAQTALIAQIKHRQNAALEVNHEASYCDSKFHFEERI